MTSKELIKQTVKYYNDGNSRYYAGIYDKDSAVKPVAIYSVYDIFDTVSNASSDIAEGIAKFPSMIANIKTSLNMFGYTALDRILNSLKNSMSAVEAVQKTLKAYRIVKPLVKRAVNIGGMMWNFANAGELAQDVLQHLMKSSVLTARTFLINLWDSVIKTPIFAIYDGDIQDLSDAYQSANELVEDCLAELLADEATWDDIIKFTNDYLANNNIEIYSTPEYNSMGAVFDDDITDVFFKTDQLILVSTTNSVYILDNDDTIRKIFTTDKTIKKIFYTNSLLFQSGNYIYRAEETGDRVVKTLESNNAHYTYKKDGSVLISDNKNVYSIKEHVSFKLYFTAEKSITNIIYADDRVLFSDSSNSIYEVVENEGDVIISLIANVQEGDIYSMAFYNGYIYVTIKNGTSYTIKKINSSLSFESIEFKDSSIEDRFLVTIFNDSYISSDKEIQSWSINSENKIETETVACSLPTEATTISEKTYDGKDYLICFNSYNLMISRKDKENWKMRQIQILGDDDGEISNNETFFCSAWNNNDFYFASQKRVFKIKNNSENYVDMFSGFSDTPDFVLPPTKRLPNEKEVWQPFDSDDEIVNMLSYDDVLEVPSGYTICNIKSVNDTLYVSMIRTILEFENYEKKKLLKTAKEIEEKVKSGELPPETHIPTESEINELIRNRIDSGEIASDSGLFTISLKDGAFDKFTKSVDFCGNKAYNFEQKNGTWFFANSCELYKKTNEVKKITNIDIDNIESRNEAILDMFKDSDGNIVICLNDKILRQKTNDELIDIETNIKIEDGEKSLYFTDNNVIINDVDYIYNIIDSLPGLSLNEEENFDRYLNGYKNKEMFQIVFKKASDTKMFQSNNSAFIASGNVLHTVPRNTAIVSNDYHCGYFTDTTANKWAGGAPYYFASNVLNEKAYKYSKDEFISDFGGSFMNELDKLLKNSTNAYIEFIKNKIRKYLKENKSQISRDTPGFLIDRVIDSVASTVSTDIAVYMQTYFAEKVGDPLTYESFASNVIMACIKDRTNNMTKDFYESYKNVAKNIVLSAMNAYNAVALGDWLITYYQDHKYEWYKSITNLTDVDIIPPEKYLVPLETEEFGVLDNEYHNEFYDGMLTAKNIISGIVDGKSGFISDQDKNNIVAAIDMTKYDILPSEEWQNFVRMAVSNYYIPLQGESYRNIVTESNMYPIKWEELPAKINRESFDFALNSLLDEIKKSINEKIYILVDEGKVKCFSCVDASNVIDIVKKTNVAVYKKQWTEVKTMITNAEQYKDIQVNKIMPSKITKSTKNIVTKAVEEQTKLFARYINQIANEEIVNTTAEVEM